MKIYKTGKTVWENKHETFRQKLHNIYDLRNDDFNDLVESYNDSTIAIQDIIQEAIKSNKRIRVIGGEWSWSKVGATDGFLLNSKPLNISFRINNANIDPNYQKTADDLYFAQCGVSVLELNDRLNRRKRSLKTSGASNGQTIAGALSTGTHGSAIDVGSIQDFVVTLHIIVSPVRHILLERKSYPVVSESFRSRLNAELIRDDELFNAALVSFGSFGFIHGIMIETDPLFLYECFRINVKADNSIYRLMETLDFNNSGLPYGAERPYHFQALINQYESDKPVYLTAMYRRPYVDGYPKPAVSLPGFVPGDDLPAFIGKLTQVVPRLVPTIVNNLIHSSYPPFKEIWGTHGEIFSNTDLRGKVLSAAIGVSLDDVNTVREIFLKMNKQIGPFSGVLAFRYVKGTKATLGFTRFDPTCIIELDAVYSKSAFIFYNKLWDELEANNIHFTFHWGKVHELNELRLAKQYGLNAINNWIDSRNKLMIDISSINAFNNEYLKICGLDKIALNV